jgi:hypothetical protein
VTDPDPRTPHLARRLLPAVLVAVVLGAGTTLVLRHGATAHQPTAQPSPTVSVAVDPTDVPAVVDPSPSPSPSASPPARPSPGRTAVQPSRSPVRPSPSPSRMPMYHVPADGLCRYVDFTPLAAVNTRQGADLDPSVASGTTGNVEGGTSYTCKGYLGNTAIREICVEIYPDRATALASWAIEKSEDVTTGADKYPELGDDAIGFFIEHGTGRYKVDVLKDNMWLFVVLDHSLPLPATSAYKAAAVAVAGSIPKKLPTVP